MQRASRRPASAAALLAMAAWVATPAAQATVVYSGPVNLAIPNTSTGLYLNVLDGTSYTGPNVFPALGGPGANYDVNIFGSATWSLFSPTSSGMSAPTPVPVTSRGYVAGTTSGPASALSLGTLIDGSSVFNTGSPSGSALATGAPVLVGFRFRNENDITNPGDDTVHYGWMRLLLTNGTPGTLVDYAFESTPLTGIGAGITTAVPEPASWLLLGLGAAALVARRRKAG